MGHQERDLISEHGKRAADAAHRLKLHTLTYNNRTEPVRALDRRIIHDEAAAIRAHLSAIERLLEDLDGGTSHR